MPAPDMVIRPQATTASPAALPVPVPTRADPGWGRRLAVAALVVLVVAAAGIATYLHRDLLLGYADRIAARLPSELRFSEWRIARGSGAADQVPSAKSTDPAVPGTDEASASPSPKAIPKLEAPVAPAQLKVDLAMSKIELVDGRYVVRGEIANTGGRAGSITKLIVTYKKGDEVLGTHTYPLVLGPIAAGDRLSFSQTLDNPPAGATDIVPSVE